MSNSILQQCNLAEFELHLLQIINSNVLESTQWCEAFLLELVAYGFRNIKFGTKFLKYDIKFYITCVIPKPGLSLASRTDYDLMILKAQKLKDLTINITVVQLRSGNDKENEAEVEEAPKPKKKAVHVFVLVACITCTHPNFRRGETLQRFLEMSIRIGLSKSSVTSTNARKRIVCALVLIVLIPPVVTTSYSAMLTSIVGHWLWYVLKPLILNTNWLFAVERWWQRNSPKASKPQTLWLNK